MLSQLLFLTPFVSVFRHKHAPLHPCLQNSKKLHGNVQLFAYNLIFFLFRDSHDRNIMLGHRKGKFPETIFGHCTFVICLFVKYV